MEDGKYFVLPFKIVIKRADGDPGRLDLATGALAQMTRLVSGAFSLDVSQDGRHLALTVHSSRGADVALLDLGALPPLAGPVDLDGEARPAVASFLRAHAAPPLPARFPKANPTALRERLSRDGNADLTPIGDLALTSDEPGAAGAPESGAGAGPEAGSEPRAATQIETQTQPRAATEPASGAVTPAAIHPYRAWRSLGARAWLPTWDTDADGNRLGFSTFGDDAVGLHSWTLEGGVGLTSHQPYAAAGYTYRGIRPELAVGASSRYGRGFFGANRPERQWQARASATWPIGGVNYALSFSLGYQLTLHQALGELPAGGGRALYPGNALISLVYGSVSWSNAWTPAQGISPSEGWSLWLSLSGSSALIGSALDYATASASATRYLAMPWSDLHVLALRLRGGVGVSESASHALFGLGGAGIGNPVTDYIQGIATSNAALRGYRSGAVSGRHFFLASAEYRLPLAIIDWGPWTLPLYFKRLHGALTADAGWAGSGPIAARELRPSLGAVLRLEALLAYDFGTQLQLGYAYGFGRAGIHNVYLGLGSGF